jgi:hypothetical protein
MTGAPNGNGHGSGDDRVRSILMAPESANQEGLAAFLALETDVPVETALQALRLSPLGLQRAKQQRCGRSSGSVADFHDHEDQTL